MIKANELRIGNYVLFDDGRQDKITAIWEDGVNGNSHSRWYLERIMPIALTGEWLEKLGFDKKEFVREEVITYKEKRTGYSFETDNDRPITKMMKSIYFDKGSISLNNEHGKYYYKFQKINSVHQLQNLYFALTGEELTVKELQHDN